MRIMLKKLILPLLLAALALLLAACESAEEPFSLAARETNISPELTWDSSMPLAYAEEFAVDYYQEGPALITIANGARYLLLPAGKQPPAGLAADIVVLEQPVEHIYLAASAVMDMFVSMDALSQIRFSSLRADAWYIQPAREAMEAGQVLFAGKYATPDYELILQEGCGLAIENNMIYHNPEVKERLEQFGIPVLVDCSSYEPNPLGRTEWVKLYGLLTGRTAEAEAAFAREQAAFEEISQAEPSGKTVVFFYIAANGEVNVRSAADYLPKMIGMAGGRYIFDQLGAAGGASTVSLQMEEFYAGAKEADYIIYNSTIDGELGSVADLTAKNQLLANFKAVQEGHVYCTTKNLYQSTMELGTFISDIHRMLQGEQAGLTYIYRLE